MACYNKGVEKIKGYCFQSPQHELQCSEEPGFGGECKKFTNKYLVSVSHLKPELMQI